MKSHRRVKTSIATLLASCSLLLATVSDGAEPLSEVVVTAEFLENNVLKMPNSVTVIDHHAIEQRSAQHLEDLLNLAPNVNFASGASRGRFIQIRGIGERSEFQESIISSVGLMVDGIDLTGIATAASTLDVQQVEVLRGPQGTLFGANALAGLINIVSNKPSDEFYGRVSSSIEEFGGLGLTGVISAPVSDNSAYRLAAKHYQSNGFTENIFLARDNTNNINETTARARYITQLTTKLNLDFTAYLADIDNGYDAFSLDNNRQTYSDRPGMDRADTIAGSLRANYTLSDSLSFAGLLSFADSDLLYGFDEDWSHPRICENTPCDSDLTGFDWFYSSYDNYQRENRNNSIDLRLTSAGSASINWVTGAYHRDQRVDLVRSYTFNEADFISNLKTRNSAVYGQLDFALNTQWSLATGLRYERRDVDYLDNSGAQRQTGENLWGGRIALKIFSDSGAVYYALISRGYKPGGFNLEGSLSADQLKFATETMLNYELGFKSSYRRGFLQIQAALFYQDRNDIQSKQSIVASLATGQVGGACPCDFTDFTANATGGSNSGLEVAFNWLANDKISLFASLGLLHTEFDSLLTFDHVNADRENAVPFNLKGREQAHAPGYQWLIGGSFAFTDRLTASGSVEAKGRFRFSDRHQLQSDAYKLLNLELAYEADDWRIALYGKNLANELVKTRGFGSFGNDPRKFYQIEAYHQYAAPRVFGIKASMEF